MPRQKRWAERNAEHVREWKAAYRKKHKETQNAKSLAYHRLHRDHLNAVARKRRQETRLETPWKFLLAGAKGRAKAASLSFDLTKEWARNRWTGRCEITNVPFRLGLKNDDRRMYAASIDRIDPKIGYIQSNCRFILFAVNCLRQNGTDEEMYAIAKAIVRTRLPLLQRR